VAKSLLSPLRHDFARLAQRGAGGTKASARGWPGNDFYLGRCKGPPDATRPMIVSISSDAETDIAEGYWFYERQSPGLGDYFRSCLIADIESPAYYADIHEITFGCPCCHLKLFSLAYIGRTRHGSRLQGLISFTGLPFSYALPTQNCGISARLKPTTERGLCSPDICMLF